MRLCFNSFKSNINSFIAQMRDYLYYNLNRKFELDCLGADRIYWGERGTGKYLLIKQLNEFIKINNAKILIQGIQGGGEISNFLSWKPKMLVGCEFLDYSQSWYLLKKNIQEYNIPTYIIQNDIKDMCFSDESFDIIASFAVYEHVINLDAALKESKRILKSNGYILASIGPLYFCFGGDHFSGIDMLEHGYNHLLLPPEQYINYFDAQSYKLGDEAEGYKKYIIELKPFNYLKFNEYITIFKKYFKIDFLAIKISQEALLFRKRFAEKFNILQNKFRLTPFDLIIKGIVVFLSKTD